MCARFEMPKLVSDYSYGSNLFHTFEIVTRAHVDRTVQLNDRNELHFISFLFCLSRISGKKQQFKQSTNANNTYPRKLQVMQSNNLSFCAHAVHSLFVNDFTISGIFQRFHVYRPIFVSQLVHVTQNVSLGKKKLNQCVFSLCIWICACPCDFFSLPRSQPVPFQSHFGFDFARVRARYHFQNM